MKIVILDWKTMTMNNDISPDCFKSLGEVSCYDYTPNELAAERIADAEAVLCNKVLITDEVMKKCPNLKYIGLFATGYNNIDIDFAAENGIVVCNAGEYSTMAVAQPPAMKSFIPLNREYSTMAVAQQVFAYILHHYNKISRYDDAVKNGEWIGSESFSYFPYATDELLGKTLSVVGYGSIGRAVAKIGSAFGMNVLVNTRTAPQSCPYTVTDLQAAVKQADVLTFHCPLTEATKGLVSKELVSQMKKSAILINTSRGAVVNETDLADALKNYKISAAYLDVLENEPMRADTPLKALENCIITPHIAWAAYETRKRLLEIVYDNLDGFLKGSIRNSVIRNR